MTSTRLSVAALGLSLLAALLVISFLLRPAPPDPLPRISALEAEVQAMSATLTTMSDDMRRLADSMPEPVDLGPLEIRLDNLERQVDQMRVDLGAACTAISFLAVPASPEPVPAAPVC